MDCRYEGVGSRVTLTTGKSCEFDDMTPLMQQLTYFKYWSCITARIVSLYVIMDRLGAVIPEFVEPPTVVTTRILRGGSIDVGGVDIAFARGC